MKKTTALLVVTLVAAALVFAGCCQSVFRKRLRILFSADGNEYVDPSDRIYLALADADEPARRKLVDDLLDALESPGGYSRLVAAKALLDFLQDESADAVAPRVWEVLAKEVIEIAEPHRIDFVLDRELKFGPLQPSLGMPIHVRAVIEVDGKRHVLRDGLPKGWRAENGVVVLDGKVVAHTRGTYKPPVLEVVFLGHHLDPDTLLGGHVLTSSLVLIAPSGLRIPLAREVRFEAFAEEPDPRR